MKKAIAETDSEFFGRLIDGQVVSSSMLAYTEVWSALLGRERNGTISSKQRQNAWTAFVEGVVTEQIWLAPLSEAVFKRANRILEQCHPAVPLRPLDALHLATCDQLQEWPLCTSDARMRKAAELLKFPLTPVAE